MMNPKMYVYEEGSDGCSNELDKGSVGSEGYPMHSPEENTRNTIQGNVMRRRSRGNVRQQPSETVFLFLGSTSTTKNYNKTWSSIPRTCLAASQTTTTTTTTMTFIFIETNVSLVKCVGVNGNYEDAPGALALFSGIMFFNVAHRCVQFPTMITKSFTDDKQVCLSCMDIGYLVKIVLNYGWLPAWFTVPWLAP